MAFLCPVRIKRNKKKKHDEDSLRGGPSMGRITGSASIETLVRVGIEKEAGLSAESKMVVLHDFSPCVDDELQVKRGQIVHVLYQENDWVYVISDTSKEGFIPHSYTAQFGSQLADLALKVKKKMNRDPGVEDQVGGHGPGQPPGHPGHQAPGIQANNERNNNDGKVNTGLDFSDSDSLQDMRKEVGNPGITNQSRTSSLLSESSSQPEVHPFYKDAYGGYIVLYSYSAQDENDLSVERGQCVTVLNKDDPEWFWVVKSDGEEGFVPAGFIYPLDAIQKQQTMSAGFFQGAPQGPPATTNPNHQQSMNHPGLPGQPATTNTATTNDPTAGRTFLATPTLASPVAQQFTQLSISPQQISSGPMSNISSLSAPLSSMSAPLSSISGGQTSLPGGQNSLPGMMNQSMSPDIISSTTGGGGGGGFNGNSHHLGHQQQVAEQHQHQLNSLGSTGSGIRSTSVSGSTGAGSTATSSGPNSLNPGTIGLPPPPNSGSGGRQQTAPGSGQGGPGSGQGAPGSGQGGSTQGGPGSVGQVAAGGAGGDTRYGGTELVMLYDYKAQAPDDLSVRRGDWIYADLQNQTVDGWLWAYAPKTRKYGFIPKAYARPPAMTNL